MGKYNTFTDLREKSKYVVFKTKHNGEKSDGYDCYWDNYDTMLGHIACDIMEYAKGWKKKWDMWANSGHGGFTKDKTFTMDVKIVNNGIIVDCWWTSSPDEDVYTSPEYLIVGISTEEEIQKAKDLFEKLGSYFNTELPEDFEFFDKSNYFSKSIRV